MEKVFETFSEPTFWVAVAFGIFILLIIWKKIPGMIAKSLDERSAKIKAQLEEASLVNETNFIDLAIDLTKATFSANVDAMQHSEKAFVPAMKKVAAGIQRCSRGIHSHLYQGFQRLFERRRSYDEADITSWLEQMQIELDKNIDRFSRMRAAALSAADTANITENLRSAGLQGIQFEHFTTPGNRLPVAWILSAARPALQKSETRK